MKISDKSQINQIANIARSSQAYQAQAKKAAVGKTESADKVDVSEEALRQAEIMKAKQAAQDAPEIDQEKVAAHKKAIAEGNYKPDARQVAQKMIEELNSLESL